MKLRNILIVVKNIEKSKHFYHDLFGLDVILDNDGNVILTEGLVLQDEEVWKTSLGKEIIPENNSCELYFEEKDIDKLLDKGLAYIDNEEFKSLIDELREKCAKASDWYEVRQWIADEHGYDKYPGNCPMITNHLTLLMAFIMGGKMACIFLLVVPVLGFGLYMVIRTAMPLFRKVFHKYDELNNSIQENIKGMRVVKSYVREDFEKEKFDRAAGDVCEDFTKAEKILAWNNPLMQFSLYTVMIFVLTVGSYVIITTKGLDLDVGQFSALLTYSFQILSSLMMLSMVFVMITLANESAHRIVEVLKEESSLKNPEEPVYEVADGSIDFENVSFSYSKKAKRKSLADINLHIRSGETIGIIGGTGSSKSSLVQLIPRLYDATEGTVKVGGLDVKNYDIEALRNQVAVVLQKNILFSGSIMDNLRWGDENATEEEMKQACELAQADEFIMQFPDQYASHIEQGGANVSGGQKQRLCIARALLKKPKILILDDSTSAVDTKTDAMIRLAFKEYIPDTTKIIIAQRISSVQEADRILVLDGGKIQAVGTHEELLRENAIYQEVYASQNKGGETDGE